MNPELREWLPQVRSITVLTGAGVSAESGIPTFRDAQTGHWAQHDPMALASPEGFEQDPRTVWRWYQWRRELIARNHPNPAHTALAELENLVEHFTLVTQNVDGFHQLAGSNRVLELHGNIQRNICSQTRQTIADRWISDHRDHEPPPSPHHPRGLARPDVVWFGEALDTAVLQTAFEAAASCELMIVAGTSGTVQPAASLPAMAAENGARLLDINPETGPISALADWHLDGPAATWLPRLVDCLTTP
ncbi:NAD-dependent deacylase [Wenzhouxiangella sp. AB-CW3]|uniref:SIR2 family NAD-dependent protein deacylase n=1 Tax=Wenzhouxiangella sp. AB-CW3 TaxID=2771012 RepID=UPI00168BB4F7|nr:NAD-dependent deacylase [Wenzhouxiangella sp. AB-CW3]QOC21274.1 NAD-dependent deacylase [Wenzhouxiangella sp. AB-CW3]